ncbi:MAG TPA: response regulator [Candidatus Methylacidiphilales bacterium]
MTAVRVLVADDDTLSRMVVAKMVRVLGGECAEVSTGREVVEAVTAADAGTFDLVLTDIEMPEMDGLEALAALRSHFAAAGTPGPRIVALTGECASEQLCRYRDAGFDACLGKPMKIERLRALFDEFRLPQLHPVP